MIPFDFEYYRPDTIDEASSVYNELALAGKRPLYFAGGTEIISLARAGQLEYGAVIDVKGIRECSVFELQDSRIVIGSCVTMTRISEANLFPLLTDVVKRTSDHTARNRITIGGNICSTLPYKESVLPLLACDAYAVIGGMKGQRAVPLIEAFDRNLQLEKGEFLIRLEIEAGCVKAPSISLKKTRFGPLEYPLVSAAAVKKEGLVKLAVSGICTFPFRDRAMEQELNNTAVPVQQRVNKALSRLPSPVVSDLLGSADYRQFVFENALKDILTSLEGVG